MNLSIVGQNVIVSNLMNEGLPNELMKEIQKNIFKMRNLRKLTRQTWNGVVDACTGAIPKDLPLPSTSIVIFISFILLTFFL